MAGQFGRRIRRGAAGTAVAAAAMAVLTASQAPALAALDAPTGTPATPPGPPISGDSPYYTELPPTMSPYKPGTSPAPLPGGFTAGRAGTIPTTVLDAYRRAEERLAESDPGCNLPWQLLAAIGQVESAQARGGQVDADGTTHRPIRGPQLDGNGFANISDTDNGRHDGDTRYDRAVGPMQFIPSTWASWGADGNGDGTSDPNNIYDAALAAGRYLCAGGRDLSRAADLDRAILGYNHSQQYLRTVRTWLTYFMDGHTEVPDSPGSGAAPEEDAATGPRPAPRKTEAPKPNPRPSESRTRSTPAPSPSDKRDKPRDGTRSGKPALPTSGDAILPRPGDHGGLDATDPVGDLDAPSGAPSLPTGR